MALTKREQWLGNNLADAFKLPFVDVEDWMLLEDTQSHLRTLFSGAGPSKLLVYYQPHDRQTDTGEWVAGEGSPELFFTIGNGERMRNKAVFLLRTSEIGKPIDTKKASDPSLLVGTINGEPLEMLEASLSGMYKPNFEERDEWGDATSEQAEEFVGEVTRFVDSIQDALRSLDDGIVLKKPDSKYDVENGGHALIQAASKDEKMVKEFQELLKSWIRDIEKYLDDASSGSHGRSGDVGPMSILEYWRRRMQRLTSITQQLKSKECKAIIGVLSSFTKSPQEQVREQQLFTLLRQWKETDIRITEAANEAKDNVK